MSLETTLPAANNVSVPDNVPAKIGPYEVIGILGQGASATIYRGRELFPARQVAIKVYDPSLLASEDRALFRASFLKEVLLAKKLKHPNITQVYDAAADDERAYIVMELAESGSLDQFCAPDKLLEPRRVAQLLESACDALGYAAAHGIIHRDLKPANILMGGDGEAKVADFGVALAEFAFDTTRAALVGSPAYMAPEQLERKPVTLQTDVYSLGIVLYKMLTGSLPFDAKTPAMLTTEILLGNLKRPGEARAGVPPLLDEIFEFATARDPAQRFASWEEFAAQLRKVSEPVGDSSWMGQDHKRNLIKSAPFFKGFTPETLDEVLGMGRWFDLRAGTELVGEDDSGYSFFVLLRGQARVTRKGTLLAIHGAGQCLAETAFLLRSGAKRFSTITAATDSTLIEFDPDVLWLASPECTKHFHEALLASMAERLVHAEGALAEMLGAKAVTLF
ncbi:protein kinase domain-containing protein [Usitatibacter palustris]|uniref:Serine/threonine-protein kinase PknD n=1 Tax=Usitatibacter palustris TaxID=2732487 RepID=A0A6M4H5V0_9PROT|nr:serine/threonine-protein kinase [Usitatibacter palustris]QJR15039.1 Serine/threonine-protein kinase PknD [Usitatibacter palustris]